MQPQDRPAGREAPVERRRAAQDRERRRKRERERERRSERTEERRRPRPRYDRQREDGSREERRERAEEQCSGAGFTCGGSPPPPAGDAPTAISSRSQLSQEVGITSCGEIDRTAADARATADVDDRIPTPCATQLAVRSRVDPRQRVREIGTLLLERLRVLAQPRSLARRRRERRAVLLDLLDVSGLLRLEGGGERRELRLVRLADRGRRANDARSAVVSPSRRA